MKRSVYNIIFSSLMLFFALGFQVAEDPAWIQELKTSLREYNANYPEEKVYLQFDKPFYKPGETIWFNAMVLSSNTHTPTAISDVLYAELIDPKGNVASKIELVIREGSTHGDFPLQEKAPGGLYRVRAFTQWMKNFGEANHFQKEIQVQQIITPRLLLRLNFEKEAYGPGDEVTANLESANLKNEKSVGAAVDFTVMLGGNKVSRSQLFTDKKGNVMLNFTLPQDLQTSDGLLQVIVSDKGVVESISRSIPIILNKITIQFFPECGSLVENVTSKVAFKAVNEFGKGADVSGSIVDENNTVITQFESFHMGMGAFDLKPVPNKKYYARITRPTGIESSTALPTARATGYTMGLIVADKSLLEWNIYSPSDAKLFVVGRAHGEIVYTGTIQASRGTNDLKVPTDEFPSGIVVFTLFDSQGIEQGERLVFVNPEKGLHIRLTTDKKQYLPREKVELSIETTDHANNPVPAKLSLSVVDDQLISFADDKQDNILSSLLLSSEVRGEIQEPSFYFDAKEEKAPRALDYLLMTQGWRRFNWKDVKDPKRIISFVPEKIRNIAGRVVDHNKQGISTEVTLIESGNKRRIEKVKTTSDGHFMFMNIDPTIPIILLARKPASISLQKEMPFSISLDDSNNTKLYYRTDEQTGIQADPDILEAEVEESGLDLKLEDDIASLSEVIVTAYGSVESRNLTSAIVKIYDRNDMESRFPAPGIEHLLAGRVPGIAIQTSSGSPGTTSNVRIRGIGSLGSGRSEPLYVIDGVPIGTNLNTNFSNGSMMGPEDIESIEVLHSPEATALFGSAAANGVIIINTKSRIGFGYFKTRKKAERYSHVTIVPRHFSATREFYVNPPSKNKDAKREDFRTTIHWSHTIVTDDHGKAKLSFYNNDVISAFRLTAEGFTAKGLIGRNEETYHTLLPFSIDAKFPEYLGFEDILKLPVSIKNETKSVLSGRLTIDLPLKALKVEEQLTMNIEVPPLSSRTFWYTLKPLAVEGDFPVTIKLESPGHKDEIANRIHIQSVGFPVRMSFSAKQKDNTLHFNIQDAEEGTIKAEFNAFPDVLSDLFTGAEGILREPYGCFEQVSSSTFPNILALQFLRQSGQVRSDVERKAQQYIQDGYSRLKAYEIRGGGFEWFGHPPAHEGLTAYGLLEFAEMKEVYKGVDEEMLTRTREWLLSRRNGKGGFKQNTGKYGFSAASEAVNNAYVTYALSETGTRHIAPEYDYVFAEVMKSKDMYRMALLASTAYNLGRQDDYLKLISLFQNKVSGSGFEKLPMEHSIVRSSGPSLKIETISLWAIAFMKSSAPDFNLVQRCIEYILQNRSYGQFGSTQATSLALKALTSYAKHIRSTRDDGEIQLFVGNKIAEQLSYSRENHDKLIMSQFAKSLSGNGDQNLRVLFTETNEPLPYSINLEWKTKEPQADENCKVHLTTSLSTSSVRVNETLRFTVQLKNKSTEGLPMTVAVVSIPAGLSAQPWQLKELQEKQVFDFYEIKDHKLILYYREMAPRAIQTVSLDLKAEITGRYVAAPSSAYLYYTNEFKHWVRGAAVEIN